MRRAADQPASPAESRREKTLQAALAWAVGASAAAFVAGTGTYLYVRFTQRRKEPPRKSGHTNP